MTVGGGGGARVLGLQEVERQKKEKEEGVKRAWGQRKKGMIQNKTELRNNKEENS